MITQHHVHTCHELVGCAWPARVMRPRQAGIDPGCWCPGGLVRAQEISDRLQIYLKTSSALYQYHGGAVAASCALPTAKPLPLSPLSTISSPPNSSFSLP